MSVIEDVIGQYFTIIGNPDSKWAKTKEHNSLVIDREDNLFFWNSRDISGGPIDFLMKVKGMSFKEAKSIVTNLSKDAVTTVHVTKHNEDEVVAYPDLVNIFWENGLHHRDYWYYRGLTDETINRFQLGYYEGWYSLPVFMGGTFRNFQMRRDIPEKTIRPWYKGVFPLLLNSDILKLTDSIIITEGTVDSLLLNQYGFLAIAQTNGAENWKKEWVKYFIRQKKITVIYDNDDAGRFGAKKVAECLGIYRTKIYTYDGFGPKYDSVDFFRDGHTKEEFVELITTKAKYSFEVE